VSSGQPFGNPRMVKEAVAFSKSGFNVTVIYCSLQRKFNHFDKKIIDNYSEIKWINVAGPYSGFFKQLLVKVRRKFWGLIFNFFGNVFDAGVKSLVPYSQELLRKTKKIYGDLYIGHNLGSLLAITKAAKFNESIASFDFEDFHRGENVGNNKVEIIENEYLQLLNFGTCASPLIHEMYSGIFPHLQLRTINNSFPISYRKSAKLYHCDSEKLKLFWFSQHVGLERGLQQVISAIGLLGNRNVFLYLLGNCAREVKKVLISHGKNAGMNDEQLIFLNPVDENELVNLSSTFHVGIASEPAKDMNNDIALSNKIFTYIIAGNAILFSNTKSQLKFFLENPGIGQIYKKNDILDLSRKINNYLINKDLLLTHRGNSFSLGESCSWEIESCKLIDFYKVL